jgi:ketosteroid isomerase-like protein
MKNDEAVKAIAKNFFAAYHAHDVEGMLALCADDAQGRYAPYGRAQGKISRFDAYWDNIVLNSIKPSAV